MGRRTDEIIFAIWLIPFIIGFTLLFNLFEQAIVGFFVGLGVGFAAYFLIIVYLVPKIKKDS